MLTAAEALALAEEERPDIAGLYADARARRDAVRSRLVTYSPKVFIPLTKLCRDVCHYCTFTKPPRKGERSYMTPDEVVAVAEKVQISPLVPVAATGQLVHVPTE